jgi:hypothetical protein
MKRKNGKAESSCVSCRADRFVSSSSVERKRRKYKHKSATSFYNSKSLFLKKLSPNIISAFPLLLSLSRVCVCVR